MRTEVLTANLGRTEVLTTNLGRTEVLTTNLGRTEVLTTNLGRTEVLTTNLETNLERTEVRTIEPVRSPTHEFTSAHAKGSRSSSAPTHSRKAVKYSVIFSNYCTEDASTSTVRGVPSG